MTGMPHWDLGPLLYDMGHWREGRVLGRPPATCSVRPEGNSREVLPLACLSWPLLHCCSRPPTPLLASSPARPAAAYLAATLELRRLQRAPAAACSTCCSYTRSSTHSAATPLRRLPVLLPLLPALILPLPRPPLPCELAARLASARQRTHTNSFFKLRRLFLPRDPFTAATASPIDSPGSSTHVGLAHQP